MILRIPAFLLLLSCLSWTAGPDEQYLTYIADPAVQQIDLYWKDAGGQRIGSIGNLKNLVNKRKQELLFATNGGMYNPDHAPLGLFIADNKTVTPLDTSSGEGNFYLKPNGVFYLTNDHTAAVCPTERFVHHGNIRYATQSGPMLLIEGAIHPAFRKGSDNLNIRNGAGILPDGRILFALSKNPVNLYDFAEYFRKTGCRNALYLDGFVSRAYLPEENWIQTDGDFGVLIGVTRFF